MIPSAHSLDRALVVLNPSAGGGRAARRWKTVQPELRRRLARYDIVTSSSEASLDRAVQSALREGVRLFVAAGGDGTVSGLVNALGRIRRAASSRSPWSEILLGAVGLGSSNDFHKPRSSAARWWPVPLRIDACAVSSRDLCVARFVTPDGTPRTRFFVVSASLGAVAAANAYFNRGDGVLRLLKAIWTGGAIGYAALASLLGHRGFEACLHLPGEGRRQLRVNNLSVLKTPHLSGGLRFDSSVAPDDGRLSIHLCAGMTRAQLAWTFFDLCRGRFAGAPGRHSFSSPSLHVACDGPVPLELDGEVVLAREVSFEVLPEKLRVCGEVQDPMKHEEQMRCTL
jgi:diacylglycerol kinase (ATP)